MTDQTVRYSLLLVAVLLLSAGCMGNYSGKVAYINAKQYADDSKAGVFVSDRKPGSEGAEKLLSRVAMTYANDTGAPQIYLRDDQGNLRAMMTLTGEGQMPRLGFYAADGNPRLILEVNDEGQPQIHFCDEQGKIVRTLGAQP